MSFIQTVRMIKSVFCYFYEMKIGTPVFLVCFFFLLAFTNCETKNKVSDQEIPVKADSAKTGVILGDYLFVKKYSKGQKLPEASGNNTIVSLMAQMHENQFRKNNYYNGAWKVIKTDGSCEDCKETGDTSVYNTKINLKINSLGFVRVRKNAACFDVRVCDNNIIGNVPDDVMVYGQGPLKNADFSAGIAYAVIIEDTSGKRCRGYLSYTVLGDNTKAE